MGLDIKCSTKKISWEDVSIPMKHRGFVDNNTVAQNLYHLAKDTPLLQAAEE